MSIYSLNATTLEGEPASLARFANQVTLFVNVASYCGKTPQYTGLQALHDKYAPQGFSVVGFPCNQFGGQEPGSAADIATFCSTSYGVTFPLMAKVEVNGERRHPMYAWLCAEPSAPEGSSDIRWIFTKFVLARDGQVVARFAPTTTPEDPALVAAIERALA